MEELLTTKEAARILGVSEAFLERDRWADTKIPYVRVGARGVRYQPSALKTNITSQVRRPAR